MKVALLFCPVKGKVNYPPLGIAYLSANLKKQDINHRIFDFNNEIYSNNEILAKQIENYFAISSSNINSNSDINNLSNNSVGNIDTLYNLNLLFYALGFTTLNPITDEEKEFINNILIYIKKCVKRIDAFLPELVGFSVYISNLPFSCLLAKELKECNKNIKIVFGGPANNYKPIRDLLLKINLVDNFIIGEGENELVKLVNAYKQKQKPESVIITDEFVDLNNNPFPNFSGFKLDEYQIKITNSKELILPVATSRGCLGRCNYCSETNTWRKYRNRDVGGVVEEIKRNLNQYNSKYIFFCDSLINASNEWLINFCKKIKEEKLEFFWMAYARVQNMTLEILEMLKQSGCIMLTYGVEHVSDYVMKSINKKQEKDQVFEVLYNTGKVGITPLANFIYGFPYEREIDFVELIYFVNRNEILKNVICTFRPFELRVNSNYFTDKDSHNLQVKKIHRKIPESLEEYSSYIDEINIFWESSSEYQNKNLYKKNILDAYSVNQNKTFNNYKNWINKFEFPQILNEVLNSKSKPLLSEEFQKIKKNLLVRKFLGLNNVEQTIINCINNNETIGDIVESIYLTYKDQIGNEIPEHEKQDIKEILNEEVISNIITLIHKEIISW